MQWTVHFDEFVRLSFSNRLKRVQDQVIMQQNGNFTQVSFTIDTIFYSAPFSYRVVPFCGGLILSLTFFQIHKPLQMTQRPISEYLSPETKTVIEYDCMPTFANILAASIIDMDKNRIVESFGIKKGIELEHFSLRTW